MKKSVKKQITYVFIDASNIIYGASDHGWKVDFKKLIRYLKTRFNASRILYYAGLDGDNKKQLLFYEKLQELGYTLRLVPAKTFLDGRKKADVDSKMTFEMMKFFDEYDRAIILTGDGDYYWVLEHLLQKKSSVFLFAHVRSAAKDLKKLFGAKFTGLHTLKDLIIRKQK